MSTGLQNEPYMRMESQDFGEMHLVMSQAGGAILIFHRLVSSTIVQLTLLPSKNFLDLTHFPKKYYSNYSTGTDPCSIK